MRDEAAERQLLNRVLKKQAALGIRVAPIFVLILVGLPLLNQFAPAIAGQKVGGFTFTWLFLGVFFYVVTSLLSIYFVRESDRLEDDVVREETAK